MLTMKVCHAKASQTLSSSKGRQGVRTMAQQRSQWVPEAGRRHALVWLSLPLMSTVSLPSYALIPDDDDEEMVERAKANRRKRLAGEKKAEQAFSRSEGFVDKSTKKEIVSVQIAVNALAKAGEALASSDVGSAANALSGQWSAEFEDAAKALSINDDTKAAAEATIAEIGALKQAASSGSLDSAKKEYVDAVTALTTWTSKAAISGLKGI